MKPHTYTREEAEAINVTITVTDPNTFRVVLHRLNSDTLIGEFNDPREAKLAVRQALALVRYDFTGKFDPKQWRELIETLYDDIPDENERGGRRKCSIDSLRNNAYEVAFFCYR